MRRPGTYLLSTALVLCSLVIGWGLWSSHQDGSDLGTAPLLPGGPSEQDEGLGSESENRELLTVPGGAAAPQRSEEPMVIQKEVFTGPEGPFRLGVRVLDASSREPLDHYLVMIALTGTKDFLELPASQCRPTSPTGDCHWLDLDQIGPWDVFVCPIGYGQGTAEQFDHDRVATVMAQRTADGTSGSRKPVKARNPEPRADSANDTPQGTLEILVETGPRVTYRGPLPKGVKPEDLRFDLRGRINVYSSNSGGAGGPARGRVSPEGWVTAAIPRIQNSLTGPNFGVRIWTADGNFGLAAVRPGKPDNTTRVVIEEPLRARAKVRFRIDLDRRVPGSQTPSAGLSARDLAESLDWEITGNDPERDALDLPSMLMASPWCRELTQVGPRTFEIGDLPPTTVTFRGWRSGSRAHHLVLPPDGIQGTATHGEPPLTVLHLLPAK